MTYDFDEIYQQYHRLVFWLAKRAFGPDPQREDIVQEAFWRLSRRLRQGVDENFSIRAWLVLVTKNLILDRKAKKKTFYKYHQIEADFPQRVNAEWTNIPSHIGNPVREALRSLEREQIEIVARKLSPKYREVILLVHVYGYTYPQTAEILGTTHATVESRLWRARNAFRKEWKELYEIPA